MSPVVIEQSSKLHAVAETKVEQFQKDSVSDAPSSRSSEEHLTEQHLAALASQHHTSEYNCLKFGLTGAPLPYIPLSVQAPQYYQQLQHQQARYSDAQAWWPSNNSRTSLPCTCNFSSVGGPELNVPTSSNGLQEELLSAISSPLTSQLAVTAPPPHSTDASASAVKTSETHPINISSLIPTELIPLISSHLARTTSTSSPTLFDVPYPLQLHRLTSRPTFSSAKPQQPPPPSWHPSSIPPIANSAHCPLFSHVHPARQLTSPHPHHHAPNKSIYHSPRQPSLVNFLWNQKIVKTGKAVIATTSVGFKIPGLPSILPLSASISSATSTSLLSTPEVKKSAHLAGAVAPKKGRKLSVSLLSSSKKKELSQLQQKDQQVMEQSVSATLRAADAARLGKKCPQTVLASTHLPENNGPGTLAERAKSCGFSVHPPVVVPSQRPSLEFRRSISEPLPTSFGIAHSSQQQRLEPHHDHRETSFLGNLLLSSCPGKKVRLGGPVNGRGGVCRDLQQDLQRMRDVGVGCIVCCLDDEELHYLGAPWAEYARTADKVGLDVLRIPIPEGLAPSSVHALDEHLNRLIHTYTLNGTPVLVHCRGGVGRAGLVACCWALKLGLCGWVDEAEMQMEHGGKDGGKDGDSTDETLKTTTTMTSNEDDLGQSRQGDAGGSCAVSGNGPSVPEGTNQSLELGDNGGNKDSKEEIGSCVRSSGVRRDTLQLIERVITLVRRRRSAKAVETFEQVRFLVEYVEFLRAKGGGGWR
ncbi:hypothetical protein BC835DRAFT_1325786 [Cytidiella melzeri]|nr:hypothetical protein BC835DRAFT_1325786 [Cytidiella melzeri]